MERLEPCSLLHPPDNDRQSFQRSNKTHFFIMLLGCCVLTKVPSFFDPQLPSHSLSQPYAMLRKSETLSSIRVSSGSERIVFPSFIQEGDVDTIRIRIGAKGHQQTATYTTKFLRRRRSGKGIERLPLGVVDPLIFRSFFPHGCTVDVIFSIETYCFDGNAGCRLVASELTLV